ncbi:MAG: hypothetical protein ACHQFX_00895 [Chitinophagales bacterium]
MKKLILLLAFVVFVTISFAQKQTFDLTTYTTPGGWKKESAESAVQLSKEDPAKGTYCLITLYKAVPGTANSKENFDLAWASLVKEMVTVSAAPEMQPPATENGWEAQSGYAPFESDGNKGVVVLVTSSGFEKMVNIVILTNTDVYEKNITDFLESISLKKVETSTQQIQTPVSNNTNSPILGTWAIGSSDQSDYAVNNGINGYIKRQYTFNANGTYIFIIKTFQYTSDKLLLTKENGIYQISGNNITVTPQKSVTEAWSKKDGVDKWGKLLSSKNRTLEKTTYQFTKHYFSGIQLWNLVLQAGQATQRDGPFSTNTTFTNAWYYAPVSANNTAIELPGGQQITAEEIKKEPVQKTAGSLSNYVWESHQNRKDALGNNAGYSTNSYQFYSNGTYNFSNTTFQYYTPKYYMVNEDGTYQINGNKIILKPVKSKFDVRQQQKTDPVLKTGNLGLDVVEYSFEYTTINDRLRLVLVPGNEKETKRDGVFNYYLNGEKTKSYLYDAEGALSTQTINKPTDAAPIQSSGGYTFTTTNFDDGWTSTVQEDWVQVTKGNIKVLVHHPNKTADAYNAVLMDGLRNAWNILVAPKYSTASNFEFKPISGWQSIEFAEADAVEKATGKTVHVVLFKVNYSGGNGRFLEFITIDKNSFEQEFGAYHATSYGWEKMEKMASYNKFAVAGPDLKGKWTNNFTGLQQYVNAYTGASAGANTHASNENFDFGAGNTYKWDVGVASGFIGNIKFQSAKSNGKFSLPNSWQVSFSDIEGKPRTYNAFFTCIKNARILWLDDTGFGKSE